jgi:predicted DNA-binding transcriptional regulator AlpA
MSHKSKIDDTARNLPSKVVRSRYGICTRTIHRWVHNAELEFPKPLVINGRLYFDEASIIAWERNRASGPMRRATEEGA